MVVSIVSYKEFYFRNDQTPPHPESIILLPKFCTDSILYVFEQGCNVEAMEWVWVAAFCPHIYYVGRVVKLLPDGQVTIKFLERRPGGVFQYRRDLETIEKKWVFIRGLKVELSGKKGFIINDMKTIDKKYEEFKKKFLLKQKVRS